MRKIGLTFLALAVVAGLTLVAQSAAQSQLAQTHNEWIVQSLKEMETIKVGMTRADLLKVFREEGGLSTRTERQYVYRECPYIKVTVNFETTGPAKFPEDARDKIVKISQPFIQWSVVD
jgi:hypothetical protein